MNSSKIYQVNCIITSTKLSFCVSILSSQQAEWACPSCTFINKPSRPGCEICATARPDTHIQQVMHFPHYLYTTLNIFPQ